MTTKIEHPPTHSPWGQIGPIGDCTEILPGIYSVSTPSHGGLMISGYVAATRLLPATKSMGQNYCGYYCYEEDCLWALAELDLMSLADYAEALYAWRKQEDPGLTTFIGWAQIHTAEAFLVASIYHSDFLIATGRRPDPEGYKRFLPHQEDDRLRKEKSPDLIVSASGDWHTDCKSGEVRVVTADRKVHFVTEESYGNIRTGLRLLSRCELSRKDS